LVVGAKSNFLVWTIRTTTGLQDDSWHTPATETAPKEYRQVSFKVKYDAEKGTVKYKGLAQKGKGKSHTNLPNDDNMKKEIRRRPVELPGSSCLSTWCMLLCILVVAIAATVSVVLICYTGDSKESEEQVAGNEQEEVADNEQEEV